MADIDHDIRARIEAFAVELSALVRRAALDAVQAALGGEGRAPTATAAPVPGVAAKRRRGRPPKAAATAKAVRAAGRPAKAAAPAKKAAGKARGPGQKRDPKDLAQLVERLAEHIKANPGQRVEHINKALAVPTKDLNLPIKKLLAAKRITSKGQKRATQYFPK